MADEDPTAGYDPDPMWRDAPVKRALLLITFYAVNMGMGALMVGLVTRSWWGAGIGAVVMGLMTLMAGTTIVNWFAPLEWVRRGIVYGCAVALIAAGAALPALGL